MMRPHVVFTAALALGAMGACSEAPVVGEAPRPVAAASAVDEATLAFAAEIETLPRNREFSARIDAVRATGASGNAADVRARYLFMMVPGWRYRVNVETGADLARPRAVLERLGFATALVPLDENGTVDANARALADELAQRAKDGRSIVLVSTSKGGPETHLALDLARREGNAAHVAAWVNIGGLLKGTAIADYWAAWPQRWLAAIGFALQGFDTASIHSMTTAASRARFAAATLPANVLVVNYLAAPLSWQVSPPAQGGYALLAKDGPNDGLTLLVDAIVPDGVTVVERGLDHFYAAPDIDERIAAMAWALVGVLEERAGR
jgi:hypothetical protein